MLCFNLVYTIAHERENTVLPLHLNTTSIYKKQSGDNDLHFSNCLPDRNFPFSTFNLKKLPLGHNMFLILQTVTAKQSVGNIPTD